MIQDLIDQAVKDGARRGEAAALLGLDPRTIERWRAAECKDDGREGPRQKPNNALVDRERQKVLETVNLPEYCDKSPKQIVPALADCNIYIASEATIYRILRAAGQQKHRSATRPPTKRHRPQALHATGPNQVWQLDFSEYETTTGGTWRIASCRDYWAKYEFDAHVSPTANMHDAVAAVELALAEAEALLGHPLIDDCQIDEATGEILPVLTIVTDNGGPFRSFTFEAFIATRPELRHVRTRVRTPGQNGSRERGFGTMKYEWLFREEIDDGLQLVEHVNAYRHDYNHVRPHEAIAWNRPADVYAGTANPTIPNFKIEETLPTT